MIIEKEQGRLQIILQLFLLQYKNKNANEKRAVSTNNNYMVENVLNYILTNKHKLHKMLAHKYRYLPLRLIIENCIDYDRFHNTFTNFPPKKPSSLRYWRTNRFFVPKYITYGLDHGRIQRPISKGGINNKIKLQSIYLKPTKNLLL